MGEGMVKRDLIDVIAVVVRGAIACLEIKLKFYTIVLLPKMEAFFRITTTPTIKPQMKRLAVGQSKCYSITMRSNL